MPQSRMPPSWMVLNSRDEISKSYRNELILPVTINNNRTNKVEEEEFEVDVVTGEVVEGTVADIVVEDLVVEEGEGITRTIKLYSLDDG
jgi:hypothetical protein